MSQEGWIRKGVEIFEVDLHTGISGVCVSRGNDRPRWVVWISFFFFLNLFLLKKKNQQTQVVAKLSVIYLILPTT